MVSPTPPHWLHQTLLAVVTFATAILFFSAHADFPPNYHPDEPTKVRQAISEKWNFHHPLLLVRSVSLLRPLLPNPTDPHQVVRLGRLVSAAFAAAAAALLALLAWNLAGPLAAISTALLLTLNHQLFELAHYFKEDAALAFGTALVCWLTSLRWQRTEPLSALALGAACAIAASAKYIGLSTLLLPLASILLSKCPPKKILLPLLFLLLGFLLTLAAINFPMLQNPSGASHGFTREVDYAVHGHMGITRKTPHGVYFAVLRESTNPGIWFLLGLYLLSFIASLPFLTKSIPTRLKNATFPLHQSEITTLLYIIAIFTALSLIPKTHTRYLLPVNCLLICFAATAAFRIQLPRLRSLARISLALAIPLSAIPTWQAWSAFQNDTRAQLIQFLTENVPQGSVIITDRRVALPDNLPFQIIPKRFAADAGPLSELRKSAPLYIIISRGDYNRFVSQNQFPAPSKSLPDSYLNRRQFYQELLENHKPLWEAEPGRLPYLQPHLKLFLLQP